MEELGKREETVFQPLNYIGQEHPLCITAWRPKAAGRGEPKSGMDEPNCNSHTFHYIKRDQCVEKSISLRQLRP